MNNRLAAVTPGAVLDLARRGQHAAALRLGEQLLAGAARDPRLDHLVGVVACQAGSPARGAELLRRALERNPGDVELRANLVRALADSGAVDEALELASRAPATSALELLRADLLKRTGRKDAALELYRRRTAERPDDADAWNNLGNTLLSSDDCEGAITAFEKAHAVRPDDRAILRNLARALQVGHREEEALDQLRKAFELDERDPAVLLDFGQALNRTARPRDALAVLGDAARLDRTNPEIFVAIGLAYGALAEFDRAEQAYYFALKADANHGQALLNLGVLLEQSNRLEPLRELLDGALARGSAGEEIDLLRALVLRREGRFDEAFELVRAIDGDAVDETVLAQMLAQLADRTGDTALAFDNFTRMNAATTRSPVGRLFDGTEHRRMVEDMERVVTPAWFAGWDPVEVAPYPPAPVFLVGFPRSGTTLLDTVLQGHSMTHVMEEEPALRLVGEQAGPLEDLGRLSGEEVAALRFRYFEEVAKIAPAAGGKLLIDKMPLSTLRAPLIERLFPDARFIFALRHPCDAVLSCFMQNFRINSAMASFTTLENSARFYDAAMRFWTRAREVLPLEVHDIRYEDMVQDREAVLRPLLEFLDLPWEQSVMEHEKTALGRGFIRTPSYSQVTEPIYARSRGRWERYRAQMEPVLDILAPWAMAFGYGDPRAAASAD